MRSAIKEFKEFIAHGNLVDLAVAVVIGAAFAALIKSLVEDLITPIIAAIFGQPDFSNLQFTINHSVFLYGSFLNAVVTFLSVAAAIFLSVSCRPMFAGYSTPQDRAASSGTPASIISPRVRSQKLSSISL